MSDFKSNNARSVALKRDRVLIIAPHGSYRTSSFIQAAKNLDVDVIIASQGKHSIISDYVQGLHIDQDYSENALTTILAEARHHPFNVVIGTDDIATGLAARVAEELHLPHNSPESVAIAKQKDLARECLHLAGVQIPRFIKLNIQHSSTIDNIELSFPLVVKPVALSGSRGVIRVDNLAELNQAISRIRNILEGEKHLDASVKDKVLIEEFIAGDEVAVEAMLYKGELEILTIFDKPEPLNGPYFEESYYITPSLHSAQVQHAIRESVANACAAYGLTEGPVHAECRINDNGVWIIEVAARTIGGLCGNLLALGTGFSLEELVIRHGLNQRVSVDFENKAVGVLMIPIPGAGILKRVEGMLVAQRVKNITEINIQVREGYELIPLPEGNSYLGFIFAEAPTARQVEDSLREAHRCLNFVLAPLWKVQLNG